MNTPDRFRAVRKDGTPVDLDDLGGVTPTELAAAVAPKADQADVDAALASVVSESDLGLIQDPAGESVPGAFVRFVLTADHAELDDIVIVGAAQMGGVFDVNGNRVTSKAVRVKLDAAGEIDDLLVVNL